MKTFGLFMFLWVASVLITFNNWRDANVQEMLKMILATQIAYIMYRLTKEESKD